MASGTSPFYSIAQPPPNLALPKKRLVLTDLEAFVRQVRQIDQAVVMYLYRAPDSKDDFKAGSTVQVQAPLQPLPDLLLLSL